MADPAGPARRLRGVHWWISAWMIVFGVLVAVMFALQAYGSQYLLEHRYWTDLLRAIQTEHAAMVAQGRSDALPAQGLIRSCHQPVGEVSPCVPEYLRDRPAGYYSTESGFWNFAEIDRPRGRRNFHAAVADLPSGRLVTEVEIESISAQQDLHGIVAAVWGGVLLLLIYGLIAWMRANLLEPVRDLARRIQAIDPRDMRARLPTTYAREEIQVIAQASNAHLARVEQFIERERSLLDQASHEFRTPIAVISGAVDVLNQAVLPEGARPALARIEHAVENLSETMVALLYLAREPERAADADDIVDLDTLLPRLVRDHEHLVQGKQVTLRLGPLEPTPLAVPEAMVAMAAGNLIRNAIEHTESGTIEVALRDGTVSITDSGRGFDPEEAARRYRESLRHASPVRGQGLGLFLISRICDRFGWTLTVERTAAGGTCARLDLSASVLSTIPG